MRTAADILSAPDRLARAWARQPVDRPPFVPGIYEHKAALVGRSVAAVAGDRDLLLAALTAEHDHYQADALVVGVDIYTVEGEAIGVPVERPADPAACPALGPPPFALTDDWAGRPLPDVSRAGRLPLMAEVCSLAHQRLGTRTVVRGALTGPWTLASALVDQTDLLCALRDDPAAVLRLLDWCARLAAAYGERLASGGAALAVFDSRLAPPLVPPAVLGAWLPLYQRLFAHLAAVSRRPVALVVGGNTGSIAPLLADCGAGELLCDAGAPVAAWLDSCAGQGRSLRVNLARDAWDDPRPALARLATANHGRPGLVVGTGVVGVADDPRMIAAIRTHLTETAWT